MDPCAQFGKWSPFTLAGMRMRMRRRREIREPCEGMGDVATPLLCLEYALCAMYIAGA